MSLYQGALPVASMLLAALSVAGASACTDGQDGLPCETIGEERCEDLALLRCNGETWETLAPCDSSCLEGPEVTTHATLDGEDTFLCADGPHIIEAVLTVPEGKTLTIEAGTEVRMVRGARIDTAPTGRIVAEGLLGAEVVFTSDDNTQGGYGGLNQAGVNVFTRAGASESSRFVNTIFERATHGLGILGLSDDTVIPVLQSATFRDNLNWGVLLRGCVGDIAAPTLDENGNRFFENGEGAVSECQ